jgi:hypothetical protein
VHARKPRNPPPVSLPTRLRRLQSVMNGLVRMRRSMHHAPCSQSRERRYWIGVVAWMVVAATSGCTVRLIGDYDDTIDKGITDVQQSAELYFAKLASTPSTPYDQSFHDNMTAKLAVLKSRASSLPMYSIIAEQVESLQKTFADFQTLDKGAPRPLVTDPTTHKPFLVSNTEGAVTVSVESILQLELALKRGSSPSAATKTIAAAH